MSWTRGRTLASLVAATALSVGCGGGDGASTTAPTPTATLPAVAVDATAVTQALVTAADLGAPWLEPKKVNETATAAIREFCPGVPTTFRANAPRARAERDLTEGAQRGASIASFQLGAYAAGTEQAWRDAFTSTTTKCATYAVPKDSSFTTGEAVVSPPSVPGADAVLGVIERIYSDQARTKLSYVRHYFEARVGRVVAQCQLAFVPPSSDPTGQDLTASTALLAKQVEKARAAFAG